MTTQSPVAERFVVCIQNDEHTGSLDLRKIYRCIPDRRAEADGLLRVVDESGEDYLYPTEWFRAIEVPEGLAAELRKAS